MEIQRGAAAVEAARRQLCHSQVVGLALYPPPASQRPPLLLALAAPAPQPAGGHVPAFACVLDLAGRCDLTQLWQALGAIAAQDAKAACHALWLGNLAVPSRWADPQLLDALLHNGRADALPLRAPGESAEAAAEQNLAQRLGLAPPPPAQHTLADLVARARFAAQAVLLQARALRARNMQPVSRLEAAVVLPLAAMERAGLRLDVAAWQDLLAQEQAELAGLGPSAEARARDKLLRQRQRSHGADFLRFVSRQDGRVHATFRQLGAQTGRMACSRPNLQSIPKDGGRRACFRPAPHHSYILADYAACELRILAQMSGDAAYLAAFASNEDVHATVARALFKARVSRKERPDLREAAKTLSFGLIYGMQVATLAQRLGCGHAEAQALYERFFAAYPTVRAFLTDSAEAALRQGYATSLSGRRLYLSPSAALRGSRGAPQYAERLARNMPIQGTGADIMKVALTTLHRRLTAAKSSARTVHCVHDAVIVEVKTEEADEVARWVEEAMRQAGATLLTQVTCSVDLKQAQAWE